MTASTGQGWGISAGGFADLSAETEIQPRPGRTASTAKQNEGKRLTHVVAFPLTSPDGKNNRTKKSDDTDYRKNDHPQTVTQPRNLPPVSVGGDRQGDSG